MDSNKSHAREASGPPRQSAKKRISRSASAETPGGGSFSESCRPSLSVATASLVSATSSGAVLAAPLEFRNRSLGASSSRQGEAHGASDAQLAARVVSGRASRARSRPPSAHVDLGCLRATVSAARTSPASQKRAAASRNVAVRKDAYCAPATGAPRRIARRQSSRSRNARSVRRSAVHQRTERASENASEGSDAEGSDASSPRGGVETETSAEPAGLEDPAAAHRGGSPPAVERRSRSRSPLASARSREAVSALSGDGSLPAAIPRASASAVSRFLRASNHRSVSRRPLSRTLLCASYVGATALAHAAATHARSRHPSSASRIASGPGTERRHRAFATSSACKTPTRSNRRANAVAASQSSASTRPRSASEGDRASSVATRQRTRAESVPA